MNGCLLESEFWCYWLSCFPGFKDKMKIMQDFCLSGVVKIHFEHTELLWRLPRRSTLLCLQPPHDKIVFAIIFAVINMMFKPYTFCNCLIHVGLSPGEGKAWRSKTDGMLVFSFFFLSISCSSMITNHFFPFFSCAFFFSNSLIISAVQLSVGGCHWRHACKTNSLKKVELGHLWKRIHVFHSHVLYTQQKSNTDLLRGRKKNP